ncbi:MAG: MarC family protein [Pseudomonadota bacterium]
MELFDQVIFFKFLGALLAMVNPLYGLPVFLSMTEGYTPAERRITALVVTLTVAMTAFISVVAGEEILSIFGISIPAFRVAGGLIILGIGLAMLNASDPKDGDKQAIDHGHQKKRNIAVVPLAIPLTIGPGAIVTSVVFAHQLSDEAEVFTLLPAVAIVTLILGASLLFALPLSRFMGPVMINVVVRVFAIVLIAIAVEMMLTGVWNSLESHFPGLKSLGTSS